MSTGGDFAPRDAADVLFVAAARLDDDATYHDIFPLTDRLWMFSAYELDPRHASPEAVSVCSVKQEPDIEFRS